MLLSEIRQNPDNPRIISDLSLQKLVNNLLKYPIFLNERPIVHKGGLIIGGNMRHLGVNYIAELPADEYNSLCEKLAVGDRAKQIWDNVRATKSIPDGWVSSADNYTQDEVSAFILVDNTEYGNYDFEMLFAQYTPETLDAIGVQIPQIDIPAIPSSDPFNDPGIEASNKFGVIVMCDTEASQEEVYKMLTQEGYNCKIVVV